MPELGSPQTQNPGVAPEHPLAWERGFRPSPLLSLWPPLRPGRAEIARARRDRPNADGSRRHHAVCRSWGHPRRRGWRRSTPLHGYADAGRLFFSLWRLQGHKSRPAPASPSLLSAQVGRMVIGYFRAGHSCSFRGKPSRAQGGGSPRTFFFYRSDAPDEEGRVQFRGTVYTKKNPLLP